MLNKIIVLIVFLLLLFITNQTNSAEFIPPPEYVVKIARGLSYVDFPTAPDILSITSIESGFDPRAVNKESLGLMQVNNGSKDPLRNMTEGVLLLRQYFLMTHSKAGAIEAYNVGISNYFRGRLRISQREYLTKYLKVRRAYETYYYSWLDSTHTYWMPTDHWCVMGSPGVPGPAGCILISLFGLTRKGMQ